MGKINVLGFEIANLIAAGEVVERPSSVLKELIENSIDSGATEIVAEIKRGGVALIRVTDNGCGIDKDDLPIALKRHATSKIKDKDDLDSIVTLGFRGEALAAISSVSILSIISKTKDAEAGTMLTAEAGNVVDISEVGMSDGTTVVVENLFYNVPARRKFLKKDSTEAMNVTALVERVALSRPDISIQLLIDGEEKFKTPGNGALYDTVYSVFGKEFASKTIKAEGTANGIRVHGFVGRSDNVKKNRNLQNVFINGRYVKSLTAMAAIEKAYTSYIAPECFPTCVLFIEMNPSTVDVNVHPTKLEVKFADEKSVFEAVYYTVKNALETHEYRPEIMLGGKRGNDRNVLGAFVPIGADTKGEQISLRADLGKTSFESTSRASAPRAFSEASTHTAPRVSSDTKTYTDRTGTEGTHREERLSDSPISFGSGVLDGIDRNRKTDYNASRENTSSETMTPKNSLELLERYRKAEPESSDISTKSTVLPPDETSREAIPDYKLVGEAFNCYVFVEYEGALLVIDKHAAHERVIFEDLKKSRMDDGRVASQTLLLPLCVTLSPVELSAAEEFSAELTSVGFEFCINGKNADIFAIPDAISASDAEALFVKMVDEIIEGKGNPDITESIRREKALYQIACKAAIKGGRVYDENIIKWLVEKVLLLPDITVCPHGRPIAYKLTKSELDRQFNRIK